MGASFLNSVAKYIRSLNDEMLTAALERCCASKKWISEMKSKLPLNKDDEIFEAAKRASESMKEDDWLEAFSAHPMIGDLASLKAKFSDTKDWAGKEQGRVVGTSEEILNELAEKNQEYLSKFGFIYIICATGKSAEFMLDRLRIRLKNDREDEIKIAAQQQLEITLLRLAKLSPS